VSFGSARNFLRLTPPVAATLIDPAQTVAVETLQALFSAQHAIDVPDDVRLPARFVTGSEREDIERHVEGYRVRQRNRLREHDAFYEGQMDRIRAIMNTPTKSR
jgi:hypothetical protein